MLSLTPLLLPPVRVQAVALECMRAAREQERDCYVYAFSGPQEVSAQSLELGQHHRSAVTGLSSAHVVDEPWHALALLPSPQVRELELNMDMKSVHNLLDFLEKVRRSQGAWVGRTLLLSVP